MLARTVDSIRACLESHVRYCGPVSQEPWTTLLDWHPSWAHRISEIQAIRIRRSRLNGSLQMQISLNTRRFFTISWHACVGTERKPGTLSAAMREAVQYQLRAWKKTQSKPYVCATCHAADRIQVDHCTVPLCVLIENFLTTSAIIPPDQCTWDYNPRTHGPRLPGGSFVLKWRQYHKIHADYQLLCQTCNGKKGTQSIF